MLTLSFKKKSLFQNNVLKTKFEQYLRFLKSFTGTLQLFYRKVVQHFAQNIPLTCSVANCGRYSFWHCDTAGGKEAEAASNE